MTPLAPLVTGFFRKHLAAEKGVSKNTIASYSSTFKFLCRYVSGRVGKAPSGRCLEHLDARTIRDCIEYLERECGNTPPRNLRLTAICSFMKHVGFEDKSSDLSPRLATSRRAGRRSRCSGIGTIVIFDSRLGLINSSSSALYPLGRMAAFDKIENRVAA